MPVFIGLRQPSKSNLPKLAQPYDPNFFHTDRPQATRCANFGSSILICFCHSLVFLNGDKTTAAVLALPQVPFFFLISNSARNIESYLKTGALTAMRTKLVRHGITPRSPTLKSTDHADIEVYAPQWSDRFCPLPPISRFLVAMFLLPDFYRID